MDEYCRALSLGAEDAGILDARPRIDAIYELVREQISPAAREAFVDGITLADAGLYLPAVEAFSRALDDSPDWGAALYNRAVVLEATGRLGESLSDYRRYLEITPSEIDPVVARVTERIGLLEGMVALPTPSPSGALALGVLFPGMGHYYSGRSFGGTLVLGAAAGAVAAGLLVKQVMVVCANPVPSGGECPPGEIHQELTERPYLIPALGAAVAVTVVGAIEAFVRARGRRADSTAAFSDAQAQARSGLRFTGPSVATRGGRLEINFAGVRFR